MNNLEILKKYFGYNSFRNGQESIINNLINKKDCLAIMPTGAGKSICYQIPALILSGITIVISPLISLMKDQVDTLISKKIPAVFLNSTLPKIEYNNILKNIELYKYKIIYISPERLQVKNFMNFINKLNISMIVVDEAHCVSQWGHNFRKSYLNISNTISSLKIRPIVAAFTATATSYIKQDIVNILNLHNPFVLANGFDRPNLSFKILSPLNKKDFILNYLYNHKNECGIIYCLTQKDVDILYYYFKSFYFHITKYHGGMNQKQRMQNQNDFISGNSNIIIATNAFGMGIDKPDIRFVIHYNMPKDLEGYYQEAGRAGRDQKKAECILLFSDSDVMINKLLIDYKNDFNNHINEYKKLNQIVNYCKTTKCLRCFILEYFGETPDFKNCNNCSNCICNT